MTLDKFLSKKMKENKNDIRAVVRKTVTTKKKESGARRRNRRKEVARETFKLGQRMNKNVVLSENDSEAIVDVD